MSREADFMLGMAHGVILKVRQFAIFKNDPELLQLIEEDYQELKKLVEKHYYSKPKEKTDE